MYEPPPYSPPKKSIVKIARKHHNKKHHNKYTLISDTGVLGLDTSSFIIFIKATLKTIQHADKLKAFFEKPETPWEQGYITVYGKQYAEPRLTAYYTESQDIVKYSYSGRNPNPNPFTEEICETRALLYELAQEHGANASKPAFFNSVLCNKYRFRKGEKADGIASHSDKHPAYMNDATIGSFTIGEKRLFRVFCRDKNNPYRYEFKLGHGDVLFMCGEMQKNWYHEVPRTKHVCPLSEKNQSCDCYRINMTFRHIQHNSISLQKKNNIDTVPDRSINQQT